MLPLLFVEWETFEATDSRPDLSGFCSAYKEYIMNCNGKIAKGTSYVSKECTNPSYLLLPSSFSLTLSFCCIMVLQGIILGIKSVLNLQKFAFILTRVHEKNNYN